MLVSSVWVWALIQKDNSVMDIAYGPIFALASSVVLLQSGTTNVFAIGVVMVVILWALRLGIRIGRKNLGKPEDERYANWRQQWSARSRSYFIWRSYLQIYLLQGTIIGLVSAPLVLAITFANQLQPTIFVLGVGIALSGLLYETIADVQLDRFLARKKAGTEPATIMQHGLFTYSRRPNYFGELTVWWGLAIAACTAPYGYIAFVGPLTITYIITKVTGPMLETIFLERYPEAYTKYMKETNYIIPNFFKRQTESGH